jgi:hypothetical protein
MLGKGKADEQTIKELKLSNPGVPLLKWAWAGTGDEMIFKVVDRETYHFILELLENCKKNRITTFVDEINQALFDRCVLWPKLTIEEKFGLPIGVIPSCTKVIQEKSGFLDVDINDRILAPSTRTQMIQPYHYWGDITDEQITELRKTTSFPLFKIIVETCVFVVRPMTRTDVQVSAQAIDDQLAITKAVTMWPDEVPWADLPAGWIQTLHSCVSDISGWDAEGICTEL